MGFTRIIVPKAARYKDPEAPRGGGSREGEGEGVVACGTLRESLVHIFEDVTEVEAFLRPGGRKNKKRAVGHPQYDQPQYGMQSNANRYGIRQGGDFEEDGDDEGGEGWGESDLDDVEGAEEEYAG